MTVDFEKLRRLAGPNDQFPEAVVYCMGREPTTSSPGFKDFVKGALSSGAGVCRIEGVTYVVWPDAVPLKLWLLQRKDGAGYDQTRGHVIRALDEATAREIAAQAVRTETDDDPNEWRSPEAVSCVEVTGEGEPGVILTDYVEP